MKIGPSTTRDERLAWSAAEAIETIRRDAPHEQSTVAVAMCDQLAAAGVGVDAIEMAIMFWSRALDGLDPGPIPADRLSALDEDLGLLVGGTPALARWMAALRSVVTTAHDLDWAIQFLMEARQLTSTLRGKTAG